MRKKETSGYLSVVRVSVNPYDSYVVVVFSRDDSVNNNTENPSSV